MEGKSSENVALKPPSLSASVKKQKKKEGVTFAPGTSEGSTDQERNNGQRSQGKRTPLNVNNIKKERLLQLIQKKKECERQAHDIVLRLIEANVEKEFLLDNALRISKQHMEDAIEERKISKLCGWVLCNNPIDLTVIPKQTYRIRGHKVYDITERKAFCDGNCYAKATHFKAQLLTSPLWLRDLEEDVYFEILEDETTTLHGVTVSFAAVDLSDDSEDENNVDGTEKINTNAVNS